MLGYLDAVLLNRVNELPIIILSVRFYLFHQYLLVRI
jgi:hypothetical protein